MKAIKWFHKTFEVPQTAKIKLRIDFDFEIVFNERIGIAKRNPDWAFLASPLTMKRYPGQRIKIRRYWITIFLSNLSIADLFFLLLRKTAENLFQGTDPGFSYSAMWRVKIGLGNAEIVTTKQPPPPLPPSPLLGVVTFNNAVGLGLEDCSDQCGQRKTKHSKQN